jgi:sugar (pentulose or hexulose) kinase
MERMRKVSYFLVAVVVPVTYCFAISSSSYLFYGFDFGTSGARCCLIDGNKAIRHEYALSWSNLPIEAAGASEVSWEQALKALIDSTPSSLRKDVKRICISGTSSTSLLYDAERGKVTRKPRMYDFNVLRDESTKGYGEAAMRTIRSSCPQGSATDAPSSTLAKLLSWHYEKPIQASEKLVHQSDWLAQLVICDFHPDGSFVSDWNNALKLGYEVLSTPPEYPKWLTESLMEVT